MDCEAICSLKRKRNLPCNHIFFISQIDDISEVPIDENCVISRYIGNPLLINGLKFDLRVYVLVTCLDPWRIYIYQEGLVRFASEEYRMNEGNKGNKFSHLTNYSINKKNERFVFNETAENDDVGNKWSLSAFCKHLEACGVDLDLLWSRIYDVILKSFITVDGHISQSMKKLGVHRTNCFELFGFDILIDNDMRPWLLEVNLSPSLTADSPLDMQIKSNLIADTLNLVGIKKFERRRDALIKMKHKIGGPNFSVAGQNNKA